MRFLKLFPKILKQFSLLFRIGLWNINRQFRDSVTVTTRQGIFTLPTHVNDPLSKILYTRQEFELDLISSAMQHIRELRSFPKGKGTLLDVGANNGVISIGMLTTGELDKAIAIEPEPQNFSLLKQNIKENHLESAITCLNYAVADSKSVLEFELSQNHFGDHRVRKSIVSENGSELFGESGRQIITVDADTLDNLIANLDDKIDKEISVVWVDVQGYEGYVFAGAKKLLSSGVPVVVEIWPYGLERAGMSKDEFCTIVGDIWSFFWVKRRGKFVKYPIEIFYTFIDELGYEGDFDNVIFTV